MKIDAKIFKRKLKKENIDIEFDGIGNSSIFYVYKTNDGRKELRITLGGYCDMEPFKWYICTKWKVIGERNRKYDWGLPWDIASTNVKHVEYSGDNYDNKSGTSFADSEYLDLILEAKEKLIDNIDIFNKKSKKIFDNINEKNYHYEISKLPLVDKWIGYLTFKGQNYQTKPCSTFFDAKEKLEVTFNKYMQKK